MKPTEARWIRREAVRVVTVRNVAALLALLLAIVPAVEAKRDPGRKEAEFEPSGRWVMRQWIEAMGGAERVRAWPAFRARGTVKMSGTHGTIEILRAPPNLLRVDLLLGTLGEYRLGFDGVRGWAVAPDGELRFLEGEELEDLRLQAEFYGLADYEKSFETMEMVTVEEFHGRPCYQVRLVRPDGRELYHYFDTESHLLRSVKAERTGPYGVLWVSTRLEEYREFEGLLLPTVQSQFVGAAEQRIALDEVAVAPLATELFAVPGDRGGAR